MHAHEPELSELEPELEPGCAYGCGCFRFRSLWRQSQRGVIRNADDQSYLLPERAEKRELWPTKHLKKLKEVSELIAGPKWKNFLRKIGAFFNNKIKTEKDFRYDSHNYALNFDDGVNDDDNDEYSGGLGFSSRFAPPVPDKPSSYTSI